MSEPLRGLWASKLERAVVRDWWQRVVCVELESGAVVQECKAVECSYAVEKPCHGTANCP